MVGNRAVQPSLHGVYHWNVMQECVCVCVRSCPCRLRPVVQKQVSWVFKLRGGDLIWGPLQPIKAKVQGNSTDKQR